jgi:hypothetical protein
MRMLFKLIKQTKKKYKSYFGVLLFLKLRPVNTFGNIHVQLTCVDG